VLWMADWAFGSQCVHSACRAQLSSNAAVLLSCADPGAGQHAFGLTAPWCRLGLCCIRHNAAAGCGLCLQPSGPTSGTCCTPAVRWHTACPGYSRQQAAACWSEPCTVLHVASKCISRGDGVAITLVSTWLAPGPWRVGGADRHYQRMYTPVFNTGFGLMG
jgi:hypothetical protein